MKPLWILCCLYLVLKPTESYSVNDERLNSVSAGLSIYREFAPKNENFVFSPISLRTIYSILYQSSTGNTRNAIKKLLFKHSVALKDSTYLNIQPKYIRSILNSSSVLSVNKIYLKTGYNLQTNFQHALKSYRANVEQISFGDTNRAANAINHWTSIMTHGLIKHAIDPSTISQQTTMIVINALYFKANWRSPFSKSDVKRRDFHDIQQKKHSIDTIVTKGYYKISILPENGFQVLELPYERKTKFSFWLILPDTNQTINSILPQITSETIERINQNFATYHALIQFPIIDIQSNLDGRVISPEMFKYHEYHMLAGSKPLYLNLLKQETNFKINTNGTEAASVTHAHMGFRSARPRQIHYFIADRPFLFAVMRSGSNDPIFFGHYVKPSTSLV